MNHFHTYLREAEVENFRSPPPSHLKTCLKEQKQIMVESLARVTVPQTFH